MKFLLTLLVFYFVSGSVTAEDIVLFCRPASPCSCPEKNQVQFPSGHKRSQHFTDPGTMYVCSNSSASVNLLNSLDDLTSMEFLCGDQQLKNWTTPVDDMDAFPPDCKYTWPAFNREDFQKTIAHLKKKDEILCTGSMCTSATYLMFLKIIKRKLAEGKINKELFEELSSTKGLAYDLLNYRAAPDRLMKTLGLGLGKVLEGPQLPDKDWPRKGDFVQVNRLNRSGHSVIFSEYLKDPHGNAIGICYWSSNKSTNGYGKQCEPIAQIERLLIGRMTI